jgi:hypothetical protein
MDKTFRAYSLDQRLLLPPDLREWLPHGNLALFISDVLEQEAQARAAQAAEVARAKLAAREQRAGSAKGAVPKVPDVEQARPEPGAQRNFTDPESRIMKDSASKEFVQAYNAQIAVDSRAQGIVACDVTAVASECRAVRADAGDRWRRIPANCRPSSAPMPGTFTETNLTAPELAAIDCYVPPDRQTHGGGAAPRPSPAPAERVHARQVADGGRARDLCAAQDAPGTGLWPDQAGAGLSALLAARGAESA